jgi:hypothetical protein
VCADSFFKFFYSLLLWYLFTVFAWFFEIFYYCNLTNNPFSNPLRKSQSGNIDLEHASSELQDKYFSCESVPLNGKMIESA